MSDISMGQLAAVYMPSEFTAVVAAESVLPTLAAPCLPVTTRGSLDAVSLARACSHMARLSSAHACGRLT